MNEEYKQFPKMIETKSDELMRQINEFKAKFEADVQSREEKDKMIYTIIDEQEFRVKEFVEAERVERETKVALIKKDIETEALAREQSSKVLHEYIKDNIEQLHIRLDRSIVERKETTQEVVKALCHYTSQLHDGVRIVSEG